MAKLFLAINSYIIQRKRVMMKVVTPRNLIMRAMLVVLVWLGWDVCQSLAAIPEHEHPVPEKLGSVQFPTSCSSKAQKGFERAVALLHSFAYSAAEKEFREALRLNNSPDNHYSLAACLMSMHRDEEALSELEIAARLDPERKLYRARRDELLKLMKR